MGKQFIKDNGKIRKCDSNYAKMSVFEYARYTYGWRIFFPPIPNIKETFEALALFLYLILYLILYIPIIPLMPIIRIFNAYYRIKRAKKEVKNLSKNIQK